MNAINRHATTTAIRPPASAPDPSASMTFFDSVSRTSFTDASRSDSSVSGQKVFAISSEPGAFITDAASRYSSGAPSREYPIKVDPATDAKPPDIHANSSDLVSFGIYGLTTSGASDCPRKITVEAKTDSTFEVPIMNFSAEPTYSTKYCTTRR